MSSDSRAQTGSFLLGLSALIMIIGLILGGVMFFQDDGGFFPGMAKGLGLFFIAAANLISWLLNVICWYVRRMRWLGIVLAVQTLPAIAMAGGLGFWSVDTLLDGRASDQRVSVFDAIKADDVPRLQQALKLCGKRCQDTFSPQRGLLTSSLHGSHNVARYFVDEGARPYRSGSGDFYDAQTSLYTCEGTYLSLMNAVDVAVANQDTEMVDLLWSVSDARTRSRALWTAAQLDRLDIIKRMVGSPLAQADSSALSEQGMASHPLLRNNNRGEPETLLRAAASGAAVDVATWLLETRPVPISPNEIQHALSELVAFMVDTDTPRSVSLGRLLVQHGANIHTVKINDKSALERAIDYRSKATALQLLALGADRERLSKSDASRLDALLQQTDRSKYGQNRPGCVAP